MNIRELATLLDAKIIEEGSSPEQTITCGYTCDLLSWVLAHGCKGMAWTTMQTHINVVAVAVLMEMACIILSEGNVLEPASLTKAREEGLAVLASDLTAYEICGRMMAAGVSPSAE